MTRRTPPDPLSEARARIAASEAALVKVREQADAARARVGELTEMIEALEVERTAVVKGGSGRALEVLRSLLRDAKTERDDLADEQAAVDAVVAAHARDVIEAEAAHADALDARWFERMQATHAALVAALAELVPDYWQATRRARGSVVDGRLDLLLASLASTPELISILPIEERPTPPGFEPMRSGALSMDERSIYRN